MNDMKILCIEDQPDSMELLTNMLEGIGYEVLPARDGEQALNLITQQSVHGVLLEYDLSDVTGATLRAQLKAIRPNIPVLLFAGVGRQTPFMLRFFDAYLRNADQMGDKLRDLDL